MLDATAMDSKHFAGQVKSVTEGRGSAIFATLGVIDRDGDITEKGAFGFQIAKLSPAHDWNAPGMGLAKIREDGENVVADFEFNLKMSSGAEWAESLRFNAEHNITQEWSYGFDVLDSGKGQQNGREVRMLKSLKVYEVSPVMVGAGIGTRTTEMKSSRTLEQHCADVVAQNRDFAGRLADLASKRAEDGRSLSLTNRERLKQLVDELQGITAQAGTLLVEPDYGAVLAALLNLEVERGQLARMGA